MLKVFRRIRHRGVKLHRLNMILMILAIVSSIAMIVVMGFTISINDESYDTTTKLAQWRSNAYNLQIASDYLTEKIRSFVTTGEKKYLDEYFNEAKVTKRRDHAIEALEKDLPGTAAITSIKDAMNESVALMNDEYYAARLTVDAYDSNLSSYPVEIQKTKLTDANSKLSSSAKRELAITTVFGSKYQKDKETISSHMDKCLKDLSDYIDQQHEEISKKLRSQVFTEHFLTAFIIIYLLTIVFVTLRLLVSPLKNAVTLIRDEKDLPMKGAFEVRFLAKTYNLMHRTNMKNREKLTYEANHDELTGLYNRRGYDFLLENVDLETCALIIIDLDRFKQINDSYGHDTGDKILKEVATEVFGSFRAQDYICRIGGDELAVIMVHSDPTMEPLLRKKVELMNATLAALNEKDESLPPISISVGVAFGDKDISVETLFKHADEALYSVKEKGRSGVAFYKNNHSSSHSPHSQK